MLPIHNPKQIDPALLTTQEWMKIVDPSNEHHPASAYNYDVRSMNDKDYSFYQKSDYPKLIRRIKLAGREFEIRLRTEQFHRFTKIDQNGEVVRINGEAQFWNQEEARRLGYRVEEHSIGAFDGDTRVGAITDEWGCVLIYIAREYRALGLGTVLQKLARTMEPGKPSGGFTSAGRAGFIRVHREFVRDALRNGTYSSLVRDGRMTMERVREIVASSGAQQPRKSTPAINLGSSDPKDWMLFVGEGDFILYDKKLRELFKEGGERIDYFIEQMVKGAVNIRVMDDIPGREPYAQLTLFGGDSPKIEKFLLKLALSYALNEDAPLYINEEDLPKLDSPFAALVGEVDLKTGYRRQIVRLTGSPIDYDPMGAAEKRFRKSFDRYGEFGDRIELGYGKYRDDPA